MMTPKSQQRLGNAFLLIFLAGVIGLWASAPVKALFAEHVLANVGYGEAGFSDSFGALPELVKDNGGAQPVPIEAATPQRIAQYRDKDWLLAQDATSYTLQVGVFSDERRIGDLLTARSDKDQFHYVVMPLVSDNPDAAGPALRYVLTFGQFATRQQADEVAAAMVGLPSQPLPRAWAHIQNEALAAYAAQSAAAASAAAPGDAPGSSPEAEPSRGDLIPMPVNPTPGPIPVDTL